MRLLDTKAKPFTIQKFSQQSAVARYQQAASSKQTNTNKQKPHNFSELGEVAELCWLQRTARCSCRCAVCYLLKC